MRTPHRSAVVVSAALTALALVGCAGVEVPGASNWLPPAAAAAGAVAPPVEVRDRLPVPFCGVEDRRELAPPDATIRECFLAAHREGRPAEFASLNTTMEGAEIAEIYRTDGTKVEVFSDFTQDAWGGNAWLWTTCTDLVAAGDGMVFSTDGCGDARTLASGPTAS